MGERDDVAPFADLMARGRPGAGNAQGYWMDIGRPPDYAQAIADFGVVFDG